MNSATSTPRFRADLVTTPVEDAGQLFIDVTDPTSGSTFRFYEVEYAIACALDGSQTIDSLTGWALDELGLETSSGELQTVISTLAELGYLEGSPAASQPMAAGSRNIDTPVVASEVELGAPGGNASMVAAEASAPGVEAASLELGSPGKSLIAPQRPEAPSADRIELGTPGGMASLGATAAAAPTAPAAPAPTAHVPAPVSTPAAPVELSAPTLTPSAPGAPGAPGALGSPMEQSFEGLMDEPAIEEPPTTVRAKPAEDAPTAVREAPVAPPPASDFGLAGITPPPAESPKAAPRPVTINPSYDDDATNLPAPAPGMGMGADPEVSIDLSEHLSIDTSDVKEAVRQSQVMTAVDVPAELLAELEGTSLNPGELSEPPSIEDMVSASASHAIPEHQAAAASTPVELPDQRAKISRGSTEANVDASADADGEHAAAREPLPSRGVSPILVFFLLVIIGGGGAYWYFMIHKKGQQEQSAKAPKIPPPTSPKGPAVTPPAVPAVPKAIVAKISERTAEGATLTAAKAGNVIWMAEDGATVAAGDAVIKLKGAARVEKKITHTTARKAHYQAKLDKAQAKLEAGNKTVTGKISAFTRKVEEKIKTIAALEQKLLGYQMTAPLGGVVKRVAKPGWVKAGAPMVEIGGSKSLFVVFELPDSKKLSDGDSVEVAAKDAPDTTENCQVVAVSGGKATVECAIDGALSADSDVVLK